MTKEKFFVEFNSVTEEAEKQFSIKHLCTEIGIGRSVYYRWKNGRNAPIRIAREAVVHLLRGLVTIGEADAALPPPAPSLSEQVYCDLPGRGY